MRTFVKYDKKGTILGTCRMDPILEGIEHPFLELKAGESVLEVEPEGKLKEISCIEIHEKYRVDGRRKKLVPLR